MLTAIYKGTSSNVNILDHWLISLEDLRGWDHG